MSNKKRWNIKSYLEVIITTIPGFNKINLTFSYIVIDLILTLSFVFYLSPFLIIFLVQFHKGNFVFWDIFYVLTLSFLVYASSYYYTVFIEMKKLIKYLFDTVEPNFFLEKKSLDCFLDIESIRGSRIGVTKNNELSIAKAYVLKNRGKAHAGQLKSFVVAMESNGSSYASSIFITDMNYKNPLNNFLLYHEIGHATKHCWRMKIFLKLITVNIIMLTLITLMYSINILLSLIILLLIAFYYFFLGSGAISRRGIEDEITADTFAIQYIPFNSVVHKTKKGDYFIVKAIERNVLNKKYNSEKNTKKECKERIENAENLIRKRIDNLPFNREDVAKWIDYKKSIITSIMIFFLALNLEIDYLPYLHLIFIALGVLFFTIIISSSKLRIVNDIEKKLLTTTMS